MDPGPVLALVVPIATIVVGDAPTTVFMLLGSKSAKVLIPRVLGLSARGYHGWGASCSCCSQSGRAASLSASHLGCAWEAEAAFQQVSRGGGRGRGKDA